VAAPPTAATVVVKTLPQPYNSTTAAKLASTNFVRERDL
jgi:hypothetical protein